MIQSIVPPRLRRAFLGAVIATIVLNLGSSGRPRPVQLERRIR